MSTKDYGMSPYNFQEPLSRIPLQNIKSFRAYESVGTEHHFGLSLTSSGPFFGYSSREFYTREVLLEIPKSEKGGD